jgi:hypothetical protein
MPSTTGSEIATPMRRSGIFSDSLSRWQYVKAVYCGKSFTAHTARRGAVRTSHRQALGGRGDHANLSKNSFGQSYVDPIDAKRSGMELLAPNASKFPIPGARRAISQSQL